MLFSSVKQTKRIMSPRDEILCNKARCFWIIRNPSFMVHIPEYFSLSDCLKNRITFIFKIINNTFLEIAYHFFSYVTKKIVSYLTLMQVYKHNRIFCVSYIINYCFSFAGFPGSKINSDVYPVIIIPDISRKPPRIHNRDNINSDIFIFFPNTFFAWLIISVSAYAARWFFAMHRSG